MKNNIYIIISIFFIASFTSCDDDWFDVKPKGQAFEETFYNEKGLNSLIIGAYAVVDGSNKRSWNSWAGSVTNWVWGSVASDDAYKGTTPGDGAPINFIEQFTVTAGNQYVDNKWEILYDGIARCNEVLKILPKVTDLKTETKKQMEGQVKFLRAHFYFQLTIVYEQVPYITEKTEKPETVDNKKMLWAEIISDLEYASKNLPNEWKGEPGRASKWAAESYLARVHLYNTSDPERYKKAKTLLDDVYTNGGFSLMEKYEQNYLIANNNNKESIFEIQYAVNDGSNGSHNGGSGTALNFPQGGRFGTCCGFHQPSHNFVNNFKTLADGTPDPQYNNTQIKEGFAGTIDPRLDHTVGRNGIPFLDWGVQKDNDGVRDVKNGGPFLNKKTMFLKAENGLRTHTGWATGVNANNPRFIRLAHVILWRAEVYAQLGDLETATKMVNLIRTRAANSVIKKENGDPAANYLVKPYSSIFANKSIAMGAIMRETRLEFGMEGMRFFDLVRWGIIKSVMNSYLLSEGAFMGHLAGKTFSDKNKYWPIPTSQIELSTGLKQIHY